jgi:hypothetical protein
MNKEDLITLSKSQYSQRFTDEIIKFFSQNICIPKGESRHPYADVLHEWIEGTKIQSSIDRGIRWFEMNNSLIEQDNPCIYRIKPQELVYEWQWYRKIDEKVIAFSEVFRTEQETSDRFDKPEEWHKFEETKRVRK